MTDDEAGDISVMLCPSDDGSRMEITVFEDHQPILDVSLIDLVAQWADDESLDGKLHPYVDGTLNVLSDMTYAILKVLERVEEDDPHRAALMELYASAYDYAQTLVKALTDD